MVSGEEMLEGSISEGASKSFEASESFGASRSFGTSGSVGASRSVFRQCNVGGVDNLKDIGPSIGVGGICNGEPS